MSRSLVTYGFSCVAVILLIVVAQIQKVEAVSKPLKKFTHICLVTAEGDEDCNFMLDMDFAGLNVDMPIYACKDKSGENYFTNHWYYTMPCSGGSKMSLVFIPQDLMGLVTFSD